MLSPKINSLSSILNRTLTEASMLCSAVDYRISTPSLPIGSDTGTFVHIWDEVCTYHERPRTCPTVFVFFLAYASLKSLLHMSLSKIISFFLVPNQAQRTCAGQPPPRHQVIHIIHSLYILPPSLSYLFLVCVIFVLAMLLQEKQNRRTIIF